MEASLCPNYDVKKISVYEKGTNGSAAKPVRSEFGLIGEASRQQQGNCVPFGPLA